MNIEKWWKSLSKNDKIVLKLLGVSGFFIGLAMYFQTLGGYFLGFICYHIMEKISTK